MIFTFKEHVKIVKIYLGKLNVTILNRLKGPFYGQAQFLTSGSPFKLRQNTFSLMLKALLVLKILTFLP